MSELNELKKELDALRVEAVMLRCRVEDVLDKIKGDALDKIKEDQESTGKEALNE